jgi:hypothetical protein
MRPTASWAQLEPAAQASWPARPLSAARHVPTAGHPVQRASGGAAVASGSDDEVSRCWWLGHPGSMVSASSKKEGNATHQASGAMMMVERGWCSGVLRQRRHSSGQRRASVGPTDGGGGGG